MLPILFLDCTNNIQEFIGMDPKIGHGQVLNFEEFAAKFTGTQSDLVETNWTTQSRFLFCLWYFHLFYKSFHILFY